MKLKRYLAKESKAGEASLWELLLEPATIGHLDVTGALSQLVLAMGVEQATTESLAGTDSNKIRWRYRALELQLQEALRALQ
jgi:hypothetical protein